MWMHVISAVKGEPGVGCTIMVSTLVAHLGCDRPCVCPLKVQWTIIVEQRHWLNAKTSARKILKSCQLRLPAAAAEGALLWNGKYMFTKVVRGSTNYTHTYVAVESVSPSTYFYVNAAMEMRRSLLNAKREYVMSTRKCYRLLRSYYLVSELR